MPKELDDLDYKILAVARELFLSVGIRKTEMKDIALKAGIGRSTLYRHFISKEQIAFYIAKEILINLSIQVGGSNDLKDLSGYEKFELELKAFMKHLISLPEMMRFFDEFDQLFTDNYPELEEAYDYIEFNKGKSLIFIDYIKEGMKDGSIRHIEDPQFEVDVLINMTFGIAQRIIPRSKHYLEEHGYYEEILEEAVEVILRSIKNR